MGGHGGRRGQRIRLRRASAGYECKPSYCEPNGNRFAIQRLGTLMNRPEYSAGTEFDGTFTDSDLAITTVPDDLSNGEA